MSNQELYQQRLKRMNTAIALEKPDRTPVCILNDMFSTKHMGVPVKDFCADVRVASKAMIASAVELGVDAVQQSIFSPHLLSLLWLSHVDIPGVELPDNALWQVQEKELMTQADYDVIINKGWNYFVQDFYLNRLDNVIGKLGPFFEFYPQAMQNCRDAGIVETMGGYFATPYELICGARSMTKFIRDMVTIPDKVEAAFQAAMADLVPMGKQQLAAQPFGMWVGGWRAASSFLNPKLWQRFVWPYIKTFTELTLETNSVVPIFHMDSNWERDLHYFTEFPKKRCIFYPDGSTNIYKIKEVLGDRMAINGDVSASLLTLGTPDEVYQYSEKLIRDIGNGLILGQACDIPINAKVENVKAMISAATGK